ncbi:hypothetical protein VNO77_34174 [Canavalia gladiata]|uniref:Uncharacterized protein n=1 Tax=Canavalia gladiata TaxID=3824 RepID=A0AAN9KDV5_CANGL
MSETFSPEYRPGIPPKPVLFLRVGIGWPSKESWPNKEMVVCDRKSLTRLIRSFHSKSVSPQACFRQDYLIEERSWLSCLVEVSTPAKPKRVPIFISLHPPQVHCQPTPRPELLVFPGKGGEKARQRLSHPAHLTTLPVSSIPEAIVDGEKRICEKALRVLDCICDYQKGKEVGYDESIKDNATELLKLFNGYRNKVESINSLDFK